MDEVNNSFDTKIDEINRIINQSALNFGDEGKIADFVSEYWDSAKTILNATSPVDDGTKNIAVKGREIIKTASSLNTPGASLLIGKLSDLIVLSNSQYAMEKGHSRVLTNPNAPSTLPNTEDKINMTGGFINTIIIIIGTVVLGLILAAIIINTK